MALDPYPEWLAQFDGQGLPDKVGVAAILGTTDGEGWSHLAYLSVGDILVQNGRLSLILWPSSETCRNLRRTGQAVLHVAAGGAVWEARLTLHPRAGDDARGAVFDGEIVGQRRHAAPYADVLGLVSYRLHDAPATIERWAEKLAALRAVA